MIVWSPSSWALWKQCPAKYKIKKVERFQLHGLDKDKFLMRLAIPGLVVDRLLQFWLYRGKYSDTGWLADNFEMVWKMECQRHRPKWISDNEKMEIREESLKGLNNAVEMLLSLDLEKYDPIIQPSFYEKITEEFALTGAADLVLCDKKSGESVLIDFKNSHSRSKVTKDQLIIYQIGIERTYGIKIDRACYLLFNPRLKQWKCFNITLKHREALLEKISEATEKVNKGEFDYKWNYYSCPRFCDARFSCDKFKKLIPNRKLSSEQVTLENL